jgi:hypothetical protein
MIHKPFNPLHFWANAMQAGMMMAEAQTVITMRLMGMAGIWSVAPSERNRMVSEKVHAAAKSATEAGQAMLRGNSPELILAAALRPYRQKTRSNSRRLSKRGLRVR